MNKPELTSEFVILQFQIIIFYGHLHYYFRLKVFLSVIINRRWMKSAALEVSLLSVTFANMLNDICEWGGGVPRYNYSTYLLTYPHYAGWRIGQQQSPSIR